MSSLKSRFPIYSRLLRFYPANYRQHYELEMLQTAADMLDEAPSRLSRLAVWTHLSVDLPINISKQQLHYVGGIMQDSNTPNYVKRNSLIAGALLLPFLIAVVANEFDRVVLGHTLLDSWVWQAPVLGIWVALLPMLALLLAVASYITFVVKNRADTTFVRRIFDITHSWPVLLVGLIALGIILALSFHDSVQCWVQTPSHLISHISQATQCSEQNSVDLGKFFEKIL